MVRFALALIGKNRVGLGLISRVHVGQVLPTHSIGVLASHYWVLRLDIKQLHCLVASSEGGEKTNEHSKHLSGRYDVSSFEINTTLSDSEYILGNLRDRNNKAGTDQNNTQNNKKEAF
jgi:hypothetical protein